MVTGVFLCLVALPLHSQRLDSVGLDTAAASSEQGPSGFDIHLIDSFLDATALPKQLPQAPLQPIEAMQQRPLFASDTLSVLLLQRLEDLALTLSQFSRHLSTPMDTTTLHFQLARIDEELDFIQQYYARISQKRLDIRQLNSSEAILCQIHAALEEREATFLKYNQQLATYRETMEKIGQDSLNRLVPQNEELRKAYLQKRNLLNAKYIQVDTMIRTRLLTLALVQDHITSTIIRTNELEAQTQLYKQQSRNSLFQPDQAPLLQARPQMYSKSIAAIARAGSFVRW